MVVDDDDVDLMQFQRMFDHHGGFGEVITYRSPEEALTWFGQEENPRIDVLLLDLKMPRVSGFEFIEHAVLEFGSDFVGSIVILTSLSISDTHLERAISHDLVKAYFRKPMTVEHLEQTLELALGRAVLSERQDSNVG
jgi:DNA-binding NarL/FixJ family response regulator